MVRFIKTSDVGGSLYDAEVDGHAFNEEGHDRVTQKQNRSAPRKAKAKPPSTVTNVVPSPPAQPLSGGFTPKERAW